VGGQGEVWRAHDPERGVDIALKILQPSPGRAADAWAALLNEHESASHLDHPGILKVYPPERDCGDVLLPMELAAGGDLRRLRGAGYLTVVPVLLEVAQALEYAHERGVVHRDLKPSNVLFDARGRAKLADFGAAARLADPGQGVEPRPLSPFSASPEQLRGEPPAPSDDVYGLGALAYELLSGYPPHYPNFDARAAQRDPVPPLVPAQQMPPQLGVLIARMLAKNAKERAASMRECIDALDAALAAFVWLPRYARVQPEAPTALVNGTPAAGGAAAAFSAQRTVFDSRLAVLESRGAGVWGGPDFAGAKTRAAESVGAYDAGSL